ncbi:NAD(P)/FAD-dependent oxidoreductase [Streptomyces sp. NBC_01803]|uniref:NAD(P)/FAD-dependent oxidoreductase n=1 Tax=Streptomyces sp. NBC_01803 TaxID=2975946 RepID=UPI002DD9A338|nr:FAD/NAD(P)-binding oxidoreductase [Streptomyces sp. NBC_01803]WSA47726.1 NAD(P)/FAD-dependent oxidoreductase [Streptomyces sp. NBC_01803]
MTDVTEQRGGQSGRVVVAGAGLAGVRTAAELREQGWAGAITLVGAEPHRPYDRPPLSKELLLGKAEEAPLDVDFAALGVELLLGRAATGVRTADRLLDTAAGPLPYDHLVLATGAEPVTLPGTASVPGVHLLRTLDDARRLKPVLDARGSVVAVGAGWIGAEAATAARAAGCRVTVVEAGHHPLPGVLPGEVTEPMRRWYADAGAELRTGQAVTAVRDGEVELADGTVLGADAVLVGIGSRPATGWLAGSGIGLAPDGSLRADERLRTDAPGVYAVGDCASFPSARYGRRLLVHHWDNALTGPRTVAAGILGRTDAAHDPVPYFWSEQFGHHVQYAGHHGPGDRPLWRGEPGGEDGWTVCWLRGGDGPEGASAAVPTAVLAVDRPRDLTQGRRLIERGAALDPERAADPSVPLKAAAR